MTVTIKWVLALSLILNVLLAGYAVGRVSGDMKHGHKGPPMRMMASLPPEKQEMVSKAWSGFREENAECFQKMKEARRAVVDILEAPEFDEAAFRMKSAELAKLMAESKQRMVDHMASMAKNFTQEERKALAQHMRRPPPSPMGPPDGKK